jgi:AcrR family transcriptional regulator
LRESAREVFGNSGFAATSVDDIVRPIGLSRGAFYRYFRSKTDVARVLVAEAVGPLMDALAAAPELGPDGVPARAELRRWLRRTHALQQQEAAIVGVWLDAALHEPDLATDTAALLGLARQRIAALLSSRGFGDCAAEALVGIAILETFGAHPYSPTDLDTAVSLIERALFAR